MIEEQPGEIAEGVGRAVLAGEIDQPRDQRMFRVDLEDALGVDSGAELLVLAQQALQMHVDVALIGDEADGAIGQALRAAHILHRLAER